MNFFYRLLVSFFVVLMTMTFVNDSFFPQLAVAGKPGNRLMKVIESLTTQGVINGDEAFLKSPTLVLRNELGIELILKSVGRDPSESETTLDNSYAYIFEDILGRNLPEDFDAKDAMRESFFFELLFKVHGIKLTPEQFLDHSMITKNDNNVFLAYADLLGLRSLIPFPRNMPDKTVRRSQALTILHSFLEQNQYLLLDGYYGKIAAHEHYRKGGAIDIYMRIAANLGINKTVFLPTGDSPNNRGYERHQEELLKLQKKYPNQIVGFCSIDEQDQKAAEKLEECVKKGGKGLKLLGGHPNFYDEPLNSENMMKVYEVAKKYALPVIIHASIINIPELETQLRDVYAKFPEITFIHAHYCSTVMNGVNVEKCAALLDEFPNLYIDLTMGGGIDRYMNYFDDEANLKKVVDFIVAYQDRVLYSTDIILERADSMKMLFERMMCDFNLQQKQTYTCSAVMEKTGRDKERQGFALAPEVLKKLYYENPKKVFQSLLPERVYK